MFCVSVIQDPKLLSRCGWAEISDHLAQSLLSPLQADTLKKWCDLLWEKQCRPHLCPCVGSSIQLGSPTQELHRPAFQCSDKKQYTKRPLFTRVSKQYLKGSSCDLKKNKKPSYRWHREQSKGRYSERGILVSQSAGVSQCLEVNTNQQCNQNLWTFPALLLKVSWVREVEWG